METIIGNLMEFVLPFWIFAAANLAVAYTAYLLVAKYFYAPSLSERCSSFFLLGIAMVVLIETLAAALGILTFGVVLILILACLLIVLVLPGLKGRPEYVLSFFDEIGQYLRAAWQLATYSLTTKILSLAIFAYAVFLFSLNYQIPPFGGDVLSYHFPIPILMYQMKSLLHYSQMMPSEHFYYPINGHLLALWFMLPFGRDFLAMSFQSLFPFLMMLTFFAILRRSKVAAPRSFVFSFIILVFPWIMMRSLLNRGIDEIFAYTIMLVFYYLQAYYQKPDPAKLILLGISAGLFWGTKYPAILFMSGFFLIWLYIHIHKRSLLQKSPAAAGRNKPSFVVGVVGIVAGLLVFGGTTYIRNWLFKGSPFFPMVEYLAPDKFQRLLSELSPADRQNYSYGLFNWLKVRHFPVFYMLTVLATLFISSSILILARLGKAKTEIQDLVFLRAAAWGLVVISLVNLVLPMPHSRMVVVFPLVALAYGLAAFRDWPIFSTKALLPWYAGGCLFLLTSNFVLPTVSFHDYTKSMFLRVGISVLISVSLLLLLPRSGLAAGWFKLAKGWRRMTALVVVLLISLFLAFEFSHYYAKTRPQFYADHFSPFYTWFEAYSSQNGQNVLTLDPFCEYFLLGAKFQNRVYQFCLYEPRPKDEKAFGTYLEQNKINLIAYDVLEIRSVHDLVNIKSSFNDARDLRDLQFYVPPEVKWMEDQPDRFSLLEKFGRTIVYQYHRTN